MVAIRSILLFTPLHTVFFAPLKAYSTEYKYPVRTVGNGGAAQNCTLSRVESRQLYLHFLHAVLVLCTQTQHTVLCTHTLQQYNNSCVVVHSAYTQTTFYVIRRSRVLNRRIHTRSHVSRPQNANLQRKINVCDGSTLCTWYKGTKSLSITSITLSRKIPHCSYSSRTVVCGYWREKAIERKRYSYVFL
jgi:hypothetical protein